MICIEYVSRIGVMSFLNMYNMYIPHTTSPYTHASYIICVYDIRYCISYIICVYDIIYYISYIMQEVLEELETRIGVTTSYNHTYNTHQHGMYTYNIKTKIIMQEALEELDDAHIYIYKYTNTYIYLNPELYIYIYIQHRLQLSDTDATSYKHCINTV